MILWGGLLTALAIITLPLLVAYLRRHPMNEAARAQASGAFADLPCGKTRYQWSGPPQGPIAVCIHGLTTPAYVWQEVEHGLAEAGYRVLTYDLFGRGYSDRVSGAQNADFFTTQLRALLKDQNVRGDITLLGYSMGAAIAANYAAKHPDMVKQLILIAPAGLGISVAGMQKLIINTPVIGDWFMAVFGGYLVRKGVRAESATPSVVAGIYDRQIADTRVRGFLPAVLSSLRNILSRPLDNEHRTIAKAGIPLTAIWGQADTVVPSTGRDRLATLNPAAQQITVPNAPHSLVYTYPADVVKAVQESLREV